MRDTGGLVLPDCHNTHFEGGNTLLKKFYIEYTTSKNTVQKYTLKIYIKILTGELMRSSSTGVVEYPVFGFVFFSNMRTVIAMIFQKV